MANYSSDFVQQLQSTILNGIYQQLSNTHTNLIAQITKVNATTINAKPVVNRIVNGKEVELPDFEEIPIINLVGGSSYIQMPLAVGDYCMLFVNERCIDNWYYGKDFTKPIIPRMHDYSDSVALVGLHNKNGELTIPDRVKMNGDTLQIGDYEHQGNREQTGDYTLTGNELILGQLVVTGQGSGGISSFNNTTFNLPANSDLIIETSLGNVSLRNFIESHFHDGDSGGTTGTPKL